MVSLSTFCKNANLMKFLGFVIIVALLLLLGKGFSYAVPALSPVGANSQGYLPKTNFTCNGGYVTKSSCRPCSKLEKELKRSICHVTGNIEEVKCKSSNSVYISCPFAVLEEAKKFWVFQGCAIGVAILSNALVWWRRQSLDSISYQRLKRQISDAGV